MEKKVQLLEKSISYYEVRIDKIHKAISSQFQAADAGGMEPPARGWSEDALFREAAQLQLPAPKEEAGVTDSIAADYNAVHWKRLAETFSRLRALNTRESHHRILEIGPSDFYQPTLREIFPNAHFHYIGKPFINEGLASDVSSFHDFDLEADAPWPVPGEFDLILAFEVLEHMFRDPMKFFIEANRLLAPGGRLVLTTPNIGSAKALRALLTHYAPHCYVKFAPSEPLYVTHRTEFTVRDIEEFARAGGFTADIETFESYGEQPSPMILELLRALNLEDQLRGDTTYAVLTKSTPPLERYPSWFYVTH